MTERRIPLARLFAMAYRDLIDQLHERLPEHGWHNVRPAFGFVLLLARDAPTTVTAIAELMGATKQAASKLASSMVAAGYLEQAQGDLDSRQRPLRLTANGRRLLTDVETIYAELEAAWADRIGATAVERLRRDLTRAIVTTHDGDMPAVRPTW